MFWFSFNVTKLNENYLWTPMVEGAGFAHIWLQNGQQMNKNVMFFYNQLSSYLQALWVASDPLNFNGRYL